MRLVGNPESPRLMTQRTGRDLTEQMVTWARRRVKELEAEGLCGFIFKSRSPSSGMERVKVYNGKGGLSGKAPGMFARIFMEHFSLLPVEDDGRLHDPDLRENFIERIFTLSRYRSALAQEPSAATLVDFQAAHKLLLMSHHQQKTRELGRLVAGADKRHIAKTCEAYEQVLLDTLKLTATVKKHTNVLHHMLGYFKEHLTVDEKQEMLDITRQYADGLLPLLVPLTLMAHYVRKYDVEYLAGQVYLSPHPMELQLRNHP